MNPNYDEKALIDILVSNTLIYLKGTGSSHGLELIVQQVKLANRVPTEIKLRAQHLLEAARSAKQTLLKAEPPIGERALWCKWFATQNGTTLTQALDVHAERFAEHQRKMSYLYDSDEHWVKED